jgi:hypothetical protein
MMSKAGGVPAEESKEKPSNPVAASQVVQGNGLDGDIQKPAPVITDSQ